MCCRALKSQSKIPLGVVIQAMALDIDQKDGGLEVVNFGAQVRCGAEQSGGLLSVLVISESNFLLRVSFFCPSDAETTLPFIPCGMSRGRWGHCM